MPDWRRIWDSADSCLHDCRLVTAFRRSIPVGGMRAILCGDGGDVIRRDPGPGDTAARGR